MNIDKKKLWIDYIPALLFALLIIIFSVWRGQAFIKTLPTLITLAVQILLARASRHAFLLGGFNSILYAFSYFCESLYFSAIFAVAISMPMQIYSYFNWKRSAKGADPCLKRLSLPSKAILFVGVLICWRLCEVYLGGLISNGGKLVTYDSLIFVLGVTVTILSAFRYVDAQLINLISAVLSLSLWIIISTKKPENINYVIISSYNLFRGIEITLSWLSFCPNKIINKSKNIKKEGESK